LRWSSVSESERTFDGPICPITREDTDFGLPFGHVVRASSRGAASCLLHIIPLNGLRPWGTKDVPHFPLPVRLSAFLVSGSTPGSYYPALWLGWVAIIMGGEGIIDNYKRRSPAWPSFVAPEKACPSTKFPPSTPMAAA
jgi:hypothetical protein